MASVSDNRWQHNPNYPYFVLDYEPEYMSLENQTEDAAGMVQKLHPLEFLCRPALSEGTASQEVIPLSLHDALRDPDTDEYSFPDPEQDAALIAQAQQQLAARSGIPRAEILKEQEARSITPTPQKPDRELIIKTAEPVAAPESADGNGSKPSGEKQPVRQENGAQPTPHIAKENPSHPTLDAQQQAFLTFISEHPDTPVSALYKALGVSVWKGNEIRDSLKTKGFLTEVALRTSKGTAGRPAKFVLLTHQAYTLFGIQPPAGRGGVIHRHLQQLIAEGATAKGYTAQVEKELGNGAIVDVHLEKPSEKIAVEFAVVSTPEREITHIRNCLAVGYDQVYTLFADENLLARTATQIQASFSEQDREKVRLLPLSQLPYVG
jgi:hypothetical protein